MPRRPKGSIPSLVHHKPSNRARVRIDGRTSTAIGAAVGWGGVILPLARYSAISRS